MSALLESIIDYTKFAGRALTGRQRQENREIAHAGTVAGLQAIDEALTTKAVYEGWNLPTTLVTEESPHILVEAGAMYSMRSGNTSGTRLYFTGFDINALSDMSLFYCNVRIEDNSGSSRPRIPYAAAEIGKVFEELGFSDYHYPRSENDFYPDMEAHYIQTLSLKGDLQWVGSRMLPHLELAHSGYVKCFGPLRGLLEAVGLDEDIFAQAVSAAKIEQAAVFRPLRPQDEAKFRVAIAPSWIEYA